MSRLYVRTKQLQTLEACKAYAARGDWARIHSAHFDWWMFPIDDGSKPEFNVESEADVEALCSDPEWLARYQEFVHLIARAWGWDIVAAARIPPPVPRGMGWSNWDVSLAKACRSLFLFELPRRVLPELATPP